MRVAIVGSGVAGLSAAYWSRLRHDVTLFESQDRLGGHAHTVSMTLEGRSFPVDTGFTVWNRSTYPGFFRLLAELGVVSSRIDMSFGVAHEPQRLEWASHGLRSVFPSLAQLANPRLWRMLRDLRRFFVDARDLLEHPEGKESLADWCTGKGYGEDFIELYLRPLAGAIWSARPEQILGFPAATVVRFFENHQLLGFQGPSEWRTIAGGSRSYVDAIAAALGDRVRTGRPVRSVVRHDQGVELRFADDTGEAFDRVILANHSDEALALLDRPTEAEVRVLGAIRYQENEAILHTDVSVMPRRPRIWASGNVRVPVSPQEGILVSYWMNRLQDLPVRTPVMVTLNGARFVDPSRVAARMTYHHPVFDAGAIEAQRLHEHIDGGGGVHYAGAYWRHGLHEDGVWSAQRVLDRLAREA